jgi:hypothetical protein
VFTRDNISTPSQHGTKDGHVVEGGKVPQLRAGLGILGLGLRVEGSRGSWIEGEAGHLECRA